MSFNATGSNLAANLVAQLSVIAHVLASYQVRLDKTHVDWGTGSTSKLRQISTRVGANL